MNKNNNCKALFCIGDMFSAMLKRWCMLEKKHDGNHKYKCNDYEITWYEEVTFL